MDVLLQHVYPTGTVPRDQHHLQTTKSMQIEGNHSEEEDPRGGSSPRSRSRQRSPHAASGAGGPRPTQAHQLHQQGRPQERAGGVRLGLVPEHGEGRRQLQQRPHRRAGLLDRRRPGGAGIRQAPDRGLGGQGSAGRRHARGRPAHGIRDPEGARRPQRSTGGRGQGQLQRRRLEGRLAGQRGLRDPGRRRSRWR